MSLPKVDKIPQCLDFDMGRNNYTELLFLSHYRETVPIRELLGTISR